MTAGHVQGELREEATCKPYLQVRRDAPSRVEQDFEAAITKAVKQIGKSRKPTRLPNKDKEKAV